MSAPALTALVVTGEVAPARPLLDALRAQEDRARIELAIAAPAALHEALRAAAGEGFAAVRTTDADPRAAGLPRARLDALALATADVVACTETHSFPEPGWAAALLAAHEGPVVAVGPALRMANPGTLTAAAGFLADYGPFAAPVPPGPRADIPGHNSSYRRSVLLGLGDELPGLFAQEHRLHARLRADGHAITIAPGAVVRHVNVSRPGASVREALLAGRVFAASRAEGWPAARRAGYAAAWPLITLLRLRRHAADARRIGQDARMPAVLPALALRLGAHSLGEAAGYLRGEGRADEVLTDVELRRDRYLGGRVPSERVLLEAIAG